MPEPLVSCLMITRNRARLAARAIRCFDDQTWPAKELVIVDDGDEDYTPVIAPFAARATIHYHRVVPVAGRRLGGLRNLSLDLARGAFLAQWDDDEWYHPQRIERQMRALCDQRLDAVVLEHTLMHVDTPRLAAHPYRADAGGGTPGTILHRRTHVRYPNLRRAEDSAFLRSLSRAMRVGTMRGPHGHLFIRCYHGANTWEAAHFQRRLARTPRQMLHLARALIVHRNLFAHPAFRLTDDERAAIAAFLEVSQDLGLLEHWPEGSAPAAGESDDRHR